MMARLPGALTLALDFDAWFAELKRLGHACYGFSASAVAGFDADAWREYFIEGYAPAAALAEDLSHA